MHLTSLGSSFAAGPGLEPISNSKARRSAVNYPSLLAKSLGATHTDLTVSGATLLNVARAPQKLLFDIFQPQTEGIPSHTDVVTITGGGNDLNYIGGMLSVNASYLMSTIFRIGGWALGHDLNPTIPDEVELVQRFHDVYDRIHARAPPAHILVVGYPTLLGIAADDSNTVYSTDQIEIFRRIAATLERASAASTQVLANVVAVIKTVGLVLIGAVYAVLVGLPSTLLGWNSALTPVILEPLSTLLLRFLLLVMGYVNISSEVVSTKRGRTTLNPVIKPVKGDLVIANWTSYIEIIYLAFRFNPTFALPVHAPPALAPDTRMTGRHTGTGSANIDLPSVSAVPQSPLLGYMPVGLATMVRSTGQTPATTYDTWRSGKDTKLYSLNELCDQAPGPVVLFPEGTTTNGRGLLRLSKGLFGPDGWQVPVRQRSVWVCWFKHPLPSSYTPSATLPISSASSPTYNPLSHLFRSVLCTVTPRTLTVKWLHPGCSPSSGDFLPSEILGLNAGSTLVQNKGLRNPVAVQQDELLSQCLASAMLQLGRAKQIGMGWEDKVSFLDFWSEGKKRTGRAGATGIAKKTK